MGRGKIGKGEMGRGKMGLKRGRTGKGRNGNKPQNQYGSARGIRNMQQVCNLPV
jgi:hypothetical protein